MNAMAPILGPRRPRIFLALFLFFVVALIVFASSRSGTDSFRSWRAPTVITDDGAVIDLAANDSPPEVDNGVTIIPDKHESDKAEHDAANKDTKPSQDPKPEDTKPDSDKSNDGKPDQNEKPEGEQSKAKEPEHENKPEGDDKPDEVSTNKDAAPGNDTPAGDDDSLSRDPVHISIIESDGVHDEVSAALVTAFGGYPSGDMKLWFANQRYGMQDITDKFNLNTPIVSRKGSKDVGDAVANETHPDIVVLTTCEHDTFHMPTALRQLLANGTAHLFCTVHHADQWTGDALNVKVVRDWAAKDRLNFITLSQHTADFLRNRTVSALNDEFKVDIPIRVLPPVFNVELPEYNASQGISLAMQGDYSSSRRDYKGIFNRLTEIIEAVKQASSGAGSVALRLIGHGTKPEVPEDVKDYVHFDSSLSYTQFYTLLSQAFSILPAFATAEYYDRKASSTVPAALIAGSPLVAGEELLNAYTYYPREAAWVAEEGETEMDVMKRVVNKNDEFLKKRQLIKETREKLILDNQKNVKVWIDEFMSKK